MRTILFILRKEFTQIFRDKTMLPVIFIMPVIQLIILVQASTLEMKHIDMHIVDNDLSTVSRKMASKFEGSPFFFINGSSFSISEAESEMITDNADIILHIPAGFEKKLYKEGEAKVQLLVNAINGMVAGLTNAYASSVILELNKELMSEQVQIAGPGMKKDIRVTNSFWYNPQLNYKIFMLPGILVLLVTIIGMFLTAINLVREKEMGTIDQINVTPIRKYQFLTGKLIPFWIIALFELGLGVVIGRIFYFVPLNGSIFLLFGFASIYLIVSMGIGLFISTISSNQQQVMFLSFFFLLVFILTSGIFTPIESMPEWAQKANIINPISYFMKVIRMLMLKGSEFKHLIPEFIKLSVYAVIILSLAVWRYRKVS